MRNIRIGWLVPIVVASVALGAVGTLAVTGQFMPPVGAGAPTPSTDTPESAETKPEGGNIAAASLWFDSTFTSSDSYPLLPELESNGLEPEAVRFILTGVNEWDFWVGRTEKTLCLLAVHSPNSDSAVSCSDFEDFDADGISLSLNGLEVHWDGGWVRTDPPTPAELRIPPVPGDGGGDVTAANSWFVEPPDASDEFPYTGNLVTQGIDESQVRLAVTQNVPGTRVWVAQQGTAGYCLIATTDRTGYLSQINCATVEEFRASGLTIAVPGLAAFWDGKEVSSTR